LGLFKACFFILFIYFGDWPIKDAHHKKEKKEELCKSSQLINMSHNIQPSQCACAYYTSNLKHIKKTYQNNVPIATHTNL
jgi:hypothetical protein